MSGDWENVKPFFAMIGVKDEKGERTVVYVRPRTTWFCWTHGREFYPYANDKVCIGITNDAGHMCDITLVKEVKGKK